jgi:hypothetical protein
MLAFIVTLSLCTAIPNGRAAADGTSPATPAAGDRGAPVAAPPAPVAAPVAARASGTFTLAQQSDWVSPAQPDYDLAVDIGTDDGSGPFELSVTVYRRLITRTGFAQAVAGTPGTVLDHLAPVAVAAGQRHPTASFVVSTGSGSASSSGIDLDCSDICSGVYPVVVSLQNTANGDEVGRLNTFLTYAGGASADPLRFALVVPISASVRFGRQTATGGSLLAPPPAAVNALAAAARTLQARADVPTTLIVDPQTVQAMLAS